MKDGNEASIASGITQFAEDEPKRLSCACTWMSTDRGCLSRRRKYLAAKNAKNANKWKAVTEFAQRT